MLDQLSHLAFCPPDARRLVLGAVAVCLILAPFAAPLHAQGGFFAQVKADGQNAAVFEAADYGLDQQRQAGKLSDHDYELAHQAEQRIMSRFASRHSGNPLFLYYEYTTKAQIINNRLQYGAVLLLAGMQIQQEESRPGTISGETTTRAAARPGGQTGAAEQPSNSPRYVLAALGLLIVVGAGYLILGRRGRKPVSVSYVNVKSPPPGDGDLPADGEPPADPR